MNPEIRAVSFSTATIRSGRVAVAKIDCSGIAPYELVCESSSTGFDLQVLPTRARQGRFILVGVRIHRRLGAPRNLCIIRFAASGQCSSASLTVLA
ncbi:MAG: hypothetical protein AB1Z98_04790 [Nannocystaceae bacterium]